MIRHCAECGREFAPHGPQQTCSTECQAARYRRQQRASKKREWDRDPDRLRQYQRERRQKNLEHYRALDRRRRKRAAPICTCQRCGRSFVGKRKDSRFCSDDCRKPLQSVTCAICGQQFSGRSNYLYCSIRCQREGQRQRQRAKQRSPELSTETSLVGLAINSEPPAHRYVTACTECGQNFTTNHTGQLYCKSCRPIVSLRLHREYKRRAPKKTRQPVPCAVCGRVFLPTKKTDKTCGADCRAEYKRWLEHDRKAADPDAFRQRQKELNRKRLGTTARCRVCGKDMTDAENLRTNRYTCSPECRAEALRRKNRRAYERRRTHPSAGQ